MSFLEIHVFGASSLGEGIVLKLPNGQFAVIDCCKLGKRNAVVDFLNSQGATELEFVCLTHPHTDHYWGVGDVINSFTYKEFWIPSAMTGVRLMDIIQLKFAYASGPSKKGKVDHLKSALKTARPKTNWCHIDTPIYTCAANGLKITAISPCTSQMMSFEDDLAKCFEIVDGRPTVKKKLPRSSPNKISIGLLIECGGFSVILGGDMEEDNWLAALKKFDNRLESRLVKVSHHGSGNGKCHNLWKKLQSTNGTKAVVTSYASSDLPQISELEYIKQYAEIYLTHQNALVLSRAAIDNFFNASSIPMKERRKLDSFFSGFRKLPAEIGCCSFVFDRSGNATVVANKPAAIYR